MKTCSSTPSHDSAADANANPTPQPRFATPSLDLAAGRKQARPPPANPYRTPTRSTSEIARPISEKDHHTSPPQGDATSPTLLSEKGVDDDDHRRPPPPSPDECKATLRSTSYEGEDVEGVVYFTETRVDGDGPSPTPPPAPDERTATRHSTSCDEGDVDRLGYFTARGRRVTPLAHAIARDPVHMGDTVRTVAMATKFPPEFLQAVDEQSVMSGIGGDVESAPTGRGSRESCVDQTIMAPLQPGGFQDVLDS